MNFKRSFIYLFIVVLLFLFSCKSNKKQIERPYNKMNETSQIYLPFIVSRTELARGIDNIIPDALYTRQHGSDFPLDLEIHKGEIIDIKLMDSTLSVSLSLDMKVTRKVLGVIASSDASMYLDFSSKISIDENWNLSTESSIDSYEWINRPEINLFGLKISVPEFLIDYFDSQKAEWIDSIDEYLSHSRVLKDKITELDSLTQKIFPIDSSGSIGAKFDLNFLNLSFFKTENDSISGGVGFEFDTKIVPFDTIDLIQPDSTDIRFKWDKDIRKQSIVFSIGFTVQELQKNINAYMDKMQYKDRIFRLDSNHIMLDKIEARIVNGLVGGVASFSGDKNGEILFLVRPFWNEKEKKIGFLDRDIKISLEDFKSKALLMVFGKKAKSQLMKMMEDNINGMIYDAIYEVNDSIAHSENMNFRIEEFSLPVQVEQDELIMDIYIKLLGSFEFYGIRFDFK